MTDNVSSNRDDENNDQSNTPEVARLRYQDRGFFALIENISDVILATDATGKVCYASPSVERVLGYMPHQVVRKSIFNFVHPQDVGLARDLFDKSVAKPGVCNPATQVRTRHRNGRFRNIEAVSKRLAEGDTVVMSLRDITDRKQTEEALRRTEHKLQLYFEQTKLGIIEWDAESRITGWNPAAELIFGHPAKDAIGRDVTFLVPDELQEIAANAGVSAMATPDEGTFTTENVARDGRNIFCDWCNTPLIASDGRTVGMISLVEEVTEKVLAEDQSAQSQRLEIIGTMASGLAQELNNILSAIMMNSQALRFEVLRSSGTGRLDALDSSVRRGVDMVNHLVSLARGSKMERVRVDSGALFSETAAVLQEVFPKTVQLKVHVPTELWRINGNPVELHQVLINLCLNARDAMPLGGMLTLKARNAVLTQKEANSIPNAKPGPYIEWQIIDSGIGIAPEHLNRIFDPFFSTKERGKGTGLGLAVTMRIIQSHGGTVLVQSPPGRGTTFKLYFPAAKKPTDTQASAKGP